MYWCAHKTATLTSIQHTVEGGKQLPPPPDQLLKFPKHLQVGQDWKDEQFLGHSTYLEKETNLCYISGVCQSLKIWGGMK